MGRSRLAAVALPLILILAACSSGGGASSAPTAPPSQPATPSAAPSAGGGASPSATAGDQIELKVATGSGSVANYLTGADGMTLYIFTQDAKDSGKSVCNGDCATNWPPLVVTSLDEVKADSGATGTLALVTRDDGTKMVSYNGMPLYYFAADKAAGDTTGQGVGGVWFVAAP
jgi:predicted lipoprotein with Yx(FWY)xxD motif